jgi:cytochrome c
MSMKRCFELSISSSVSLVGRAILVGSVLSFATACAHRDAAKTDSTVASADSATTATTTTATVTPASAVESISTGEAALPSDSSKVKTVAATSVSAPATKPAATSPAAAKPAHHAATTATAAATKPATSPAAAPAAASPVAPAATATAAADTGEKAGADTSKKTAAAGGDKLLVDADTYEGWKIFASNCFRCHGEDAMGGTFAPNLRHSLGPDGGITHDLFLVTVTNGRPTKGMPAWGATYTKEQFEQIYKYLIARSNGSLAPGRPHRATDAKRAS